MRVSGEYQFDGPRAVVWDTLLDPEVLASVLPGCDKLELIGQHEYEGALNIKVGPVQGSFMGKVKLEDLEQPVSYTMHVDGRGGPGFVKAVGSLELADEGDGTKVRYEGDAQVGGKLASVGQRLVESSAKAIIKQSLDGLNAHVVDRVASTGAGEGGAREPMPVRAAPSDTQFASAVAREVAKDLVPPWARVVGVFVALLVILYVISLLA